MPGSGQRCISRSLSFNVRRSAEVTWIMGRLKDKKMDENDFKCSWGVGFSHLVRTFMASTPIAYQVGVVLTSPVSQVSGSCESETQGVP